jgi:hypothetical protein
VKGPRQGRNSGRSIRGAKEPSDTCSTNESAHRPAAPMSSRGSAPPYRREALPKGHVAGRVAATLTAGATSWDVSISKNVGADRVARDFNAPRFPGLHSVYLAWPRAVEGYRVLAPPGLELSDDMHLEIYLHIDQIRRVHSYIPPTTIPFEGTDVLVHVTPGGARLMKDSRAVWTEEVTYAQERGAFPHPGAHRTNLGWPRRARLDLGKRKAGGRILGRSSDSRAAPGDGLCDRRPPKE